MSTRWHYRVVDQQLGLKAQFSSETQRAELQGLLDELGRQGWELVAVTVPTTGGATRLFLKRPA